MKNLVAETTLTESPVEVICPDRSGIGRAKLSRWRLWATKGSLAIVDQGLISGSNFLIGILLARWLLPAQYGAYGIAFEIFLLLSFLHQALLLEPQRVFGPSDYPNSREYLGTLLWLHAGLAVVIFAALGISCWLLHELTRPDNLSGALVGVAVGAPCILLLWLARNACYVKLAPQAAAAGAALYCAVVLSGLFLLQRFKLVSPFSAFLLMGSGALASSAFLLIPLKPALKLRASRQMWRKVGEQHWEYGRWVLASLGLSAISGGIYYPLLGSFSGLAAVGELKALLNFSLPVAQTLTALSMFLLPYASRIYQENGRSGLKRLISKIMWLFGTATCGYWALLILFSKPILRSLYGGHYTELAPLIPWLAVGSLPWNIAAVPAIFLRAVRSPVSIFRAYCVSSVVVLLVGIPATWALGLRGSLFTMILSNLAALIVVVTLLRRKLQDISVLEHEEC